MPTNTKAKKEKNNQPKFYATGRRKEASARVWISNGSGKITVNHTDIENYFSRPVLKMLIHQPFAVTSTTGKYDVFCTVKGSGLSGQAGAIRHGISRALDKVSDDFHDMLRKSDINLLTRDSRKVERKKYGRKKARKRFQFSKR